MKTLSDFHAFSVQDLSNAKILYENSSFASSLYHFQQSVEKLAKAYSIATNTMPFADLKHKVGHRGYKIFKKQSQLAKENIDLAIQLQQSHPEFFQSAPHRKLDIKEYQEAVAKSMKHLEHLKSDNFHELLSEDINFLLNEAENLENQDLEIDEKDFLNEFPELLKSYFHQIEKYAPDDVGCLIKGLENRDLCTAFGQIGLECFRILPKLNYLAHGLFILSLITSSHQDTTRYPCGDCGYSPLEYYTDDLPIIKKLPELFQWHEKIITTFANMYLHSNDLQIRFPKAFVKII